MNEEQKNELKSKLKSQGYTGISLIEKLEESGCEVFAPDYAEEGLPKPVTCHCFCLNCVAVWEIDNLHDAKNPCAVCGHKPSQRGHFQVVRYFEVYDEDDAELVGILEMGDGFEGLPRQGTKSELEAVIDLYEHQMKQQQNTSEDENTKFIVPVEGISAEEFRYLVSR